MKRSSERGILLPDWMKPAVIVDEDERPLNGKIETVFRRIGNQTMV
jgi:hypothetical protein